MQKSIRLAGQIASLLLVSAGSIASAATYDLVGDFGDPVFQYGGGDSALYASGAGGASFAPFTTFVMCGIGAALECQHSGSYPYLQRNAGASDYVDGPNGVLIPAGGFMLHPGTGSVAGVLRFSALAAGTYELNGLFTRLQAPDGDGVTVAIYKVSGGITSQLFSQLLPNGAQLSTIGYSLTSNLLAGEALDFLITSGGTNFSDGTMISGTIATAAAVPEPASWAMMIGGFALAGAALRQRQARIAYC